MFINRFIFRYFRIQNWRKHMIVTIDLTKEDVSCVEHPIIKLVRTLNEINEKEVIVIASKEDIPSIRILEMIADKMRYKVTDVYEDDKIIRAKFVKEE